MRYLKSYNKFNINEANYNLRTLKYAISNGQPLWVSVEGKDNIIYRVKDVNYDKNPFDGSLDVIWDDGEIFTIEDTDIEHTITAFDLVKLKEKNKDLIITGNLDS